MRGDVRFGSKADISGRFTKPVFPLIAARNADIGKLTSSVTEECDHARYRGFDHACG
jgi:hypothetical protein